MKKKYATLNYFDDLKRDLKDDEFKRIFAAEKHRLEVALMIAGMRKSRRLTQIQLAKALKTNQSAVARIESGKENVTIDTLSRVAKVMHKRLKIQFV